MQHVASKYFLLFKTCIMESKGKNGKERTQIFDKDGVDAFVLRFVELRKASGMSQRQLSYETGISQSYIGRLEKGKVNPTISVVFKIARTMEIEPEEFFKFRLLSQEQ